MNAFALPCAINTLMATQISKPRLRASKCSTSSHWAKRWLQSGAVTGEELARIHWQKLLDTSSRYLQRKAALDQMRHQRLPWVLRPSAWVIRIQRDRVRRRMNTLRDLGLQTTPPSEAS